MGAWSAEPFGNDTAADWAWELEENDDWSFVADAVGPVFQADGVIDQDVATVTIAAAEVVAHGLGRATQDDAYTEAVGPFVGRAGTPPDFLVELAVAALALATGPTSELTELWDETGSDEWREANTKIEGALRG
jgi:hypothetical protein